MAIDRIQNQTSFTQRPNVDLKSGSVNMERYIPLPKRHYRNHNEIPDSVNMIRPEPGQGHLLNGGFFSSIGRFFSNRVYDIKSIYKGYTGTANDHQLGRTNDVGLVLGGLGIASFLATKRVATMPKHMEFVGLASFLGAMALWPKIGIFGPARFVHGFDVDKRYIDDQGRNKSVFQDPNYVPFDLYRGNKKSEDLSAIADYMGIDKDADNREEMVKDQMLKVARQNNTLWMLTSGIAVPTLTALMCNAFERVYEPFIVNKKSALYNEKLNAMYNTVVKGAVEPKESKIKSLFKKTNNNSIVKEITNFATLDGGKPKLLSAKEVLNFVNSITQGAGAGVSEAMAKDITGILSANGNVVVDNKYVEELAKNIEAKFQGHQYLKKGIISYEEIKKLLLDDKSFIKTDSRNITEKLINAVKEKIASSDISAAGSMSREDIIKRVQSMAFTQINEPDLLPKSEKYVLTGDAAIKIQSIAGSFDTYMKRFKQLREINELKMGDIADSQNAYFWKKLEKTFTQIAVPNNVITSKSLKPMLDNPKMIEEAIMKNLDQVVSDKKQYNQAVRAIETIKREYLTAMFGTDDARVYNDFILGANPQGGTAWQRRTGNQGYYIDKFIELQRRISEDLLVDVSKNNKDNFKNLLNIIGGSIPRDKDGKPLPRDYRMSVAYRETKANVNKIENFVTECDRLIHSLDIYKRAMDYPSKTKDPELKKHYFMQLFKEAKHNVIAAESHDFFARFHALNNPRKFNEYMNLIYAKDYILDETANAMNEIPVDDNEGKNKTLQQIKEKIQKGYECIKEKAAQLVKEENTTPSANNSIETTKEWIRRIRALFGGGYENNGYFETDWQYSEFIISDSDHLGNYNDGLLHTAEARYKAQGKAPLELVNQGIKKSYNSNKWLRTFGGLFIGVFGISVLSQFFFGKKDSTIPLEKARRARIKKAEAQKIEANNKNIEEAQKERKELEVEAENAN